jgi:hypothetical protein
MWNTSANEWTYKFGWPSYNSIRVITENPLKKAKLKKKSKTRIEHELRYDELSEYEYRQNENDRLHDSIFAVESTNEFFKFD